MLDAIINNTGRIDIHTNKLGLARSILAFSTLITITFNNPYELINPMNIHNIYIEDSKLYSQLNYFLIFKDTPIVAVLFAILGLFILISGYLQFITSVFYWWLTFSISSFSLIEGGDQIASILAFLLIPICFTDTRKNHWQKHDVSLTNKKEIYNCVANLTRYVIILQMSVLYFIASTAKFNNTYWIDGTAIYYWLNNNIFGVNDGLLGFVNYLLYKNYLIFTITWSVLIIELLLSISFLLNKSLRKVILYVGISFHLGIAILHGLISFSLAMIGGLILYISSLDRGF